jgi:acetyl-CoA C-acetyltransferase
VLGYAHAGVRPEVMGIGPVPAVQKLLERTGLTPTIST